MCLGCAEKAPPAVFTGFYMKKILFLSNTANFSKFNLPYMRWFREQGWQVDYCSAGEETVPDCDNQYSISIARSPFSLKNLRAYSELKKLLLENEYDILHCHTPMGGVLGRLAASGLRKKHKIRVIYTAHGFHFYKGAPLFNWLFYYPVERQLARKTDLLITINKEDFKRAENFRAAKVIYIPGVGVNIDKLGQIACGREAKRVELGVQQSDFIILSVGELIKRKNHILTLEALAILKKKCGLNGIQFLICGSGILEKTLKEKAESLGISDHVRFLGYRKDIGELCAASDLFVFMSLQEGLPVALMEAMACGVPVVCSEIRGNTDLVENRKSGEIVESRPQDLADAILKLKNDRALRDFYAQNAAVAVRRFDLASVEPEMQAAYLGEIAETEKSVI